MCMAAVVHSLYSVETVVFHPCIMCMAIYHAYLANLSSKLIVLVDLMSCPIKDFLVFSDSTHAVGCGGVLTGCS